MIKTQHIFFLCIYLGCVLLFGQDSQGMVIQIPAAQNSVLPFARAATNELVPLSNHANKNSNSEKNSFQKKKPLFRLTRHLLSSDLQQEFLRKMMQRPQIIKDAIEYMYKNQNSFLQNSIKNMLIPPPSIIKNMFYNYNASVCNTDNRTAVVSFSNNQLHNQQELAKICCGAVLYLSYYYNLVQQNNSDTKKCAAQRERTNKTNAHVVEDVSEQEQPWQTEPEVNDCQEKDTASIGDLATVTKENKELINQTKSLQTLIIQLKTQKDSFEKKYLSKINNCKFLTEQFRRLTNCMHFQEKQYQSEKTLLENENRDLKNNQKSLEQTQKDSIAKQEALEKTIQENNDRLNELEIEKNSHLLQIQNLEQHNAENKTTFDALITLYKEENSNLKEENESLKIMQEELEQALQENNSQLQKLEIEKKEHLIQIQNLEQENDEKKEAHEKLTLIHQEKEEKNNRLEEENANLSAVIHNLNESLNDIRTEHVELTESLKSIAGLIKEDCTEDTKEQLAAANDSVTKVGKILKKDAIAFQEDALLNKNKCDWLKIGLSIAIALLLVENYFLYHKIDILTAATKKLI